MTERPATSPSQLVLSLVLVPLLVFGLGLGLWLRATPLDAAFLFGDELHSLGAIHLPWSRLFARYDAVGSGLALPVLQKALVAAFGASLPVIRAVAFVPSLLLVAAVAWWARLEGGRSAAAIAALVVALTPVFVFYGHFARSYSLAALLCVGVSIACRRPGDVGRAGDGNGGADWGRAAVIAVLGGLAVYAHLVSVFFLTALGAGVLAASLAREGVRGVARQPSLLGLAAAAGLALALHWPAIDSVLAFVGHKGEQSYQPGFGPFDVMLVLAGSAAGAALASLALAASAVGEVRARGWGAAPLVSATFGPPLILWIVSPYGDAYAYARYLLPSAAAACVLLGLGAWRSGCWARARVGGWPVELTGVAFAFGLFVCGPGGPFAPRLGPFANTYLGLYALPAFAAGGSAPRESPPPAPEWYERVVGITPPLTLVEVPPLRNRAVHYLAALWRWHGQDVRMGTFGPIVAGAPRIESELYVDLTRLDRAEPRSFDALIVHRRISDEVERYWARVYSREPEGPGRALLERHRRYGHDLPSVGRGVVEDLESILGAPSYEDVDVVVWRSSAPDASGS